MTMMPITPTAPSTQSSTRRDALAGARDITPMVISVLPLGLAIGATIDTGFIAVRRTGNVMHAITAGMPALWLLTIVGG